VFRPFQAEDLEAYLALSREFYSSQATDHPVPEDHFHRTFQETVSGSVLARGWLISAEADRPAGYMLASLAWSNEFGGRVAWLEELYLRPEARGLGLGRETIEQVMRELKSRDQVRGFRLETAPANEGVSLLYQKLGFSRAPYHGWWMAV
jgi:ribosomal protein S18 acetylase RimI-like enzyme